MSATSGSGSREVIQKKDPYWWMHPAYKGEQALDLATLDALPAGAYRHLTYAKREQYSVDPDVMQYPKGNFVEFAQLLYKANGFRSGPVDNWYVVICVDPSKRWAVGQLCADPETPIWVFDDLVFDSEETAREKAQSLKGSRIDTPTE